MEIVSENKINFTAAQQTDNSRVVIEGKVKKPRNPIIIAGEYLIRAVMGVRSLSLTYTKSQGEYLPGYNPDTKFLGMSKVNGNLAPGWPFIMGYSDKNFFDRAVSKGWLSKDSLINFLKEWNSLIPTSSMEYVNQNETIKNIYSLFFDLYKVRTARTCNSWLYGLVLVGTTI